MLDLRHGFHKMPLQKRGWPSEGDVHSLWHCPVDCDAHGPHECGGNVSKKPMENLLFQKHQSLDLQDFCSIYIDDLLIATPLQENLEEWLKKHKEHVPEVLEVLQQEKLLCGPNKGKMFLQIVELCGPLSEDGTLRYAPDKMAALQLWERPKTIPQLPAFLGCCKCYNQLVPLYAKYSGPLTELLKFGKVEGKKGPQVKLKWKPECEVAFTRLKEALANVVTLKTPQFDGRPFYLRTDASRYAIGATID